MGRGVTQTESTGDDRRGSSGFRWAASGLLCAVLVFSPLESPWGALAGTAQQGDLNFSKKFLDDPVRQGDSTTLEFTIANTSAGPVTNLTFTDDLNAVIPGLRAVFRFPAENPCGPGSLLSGTTRLIFSGGSLDPGTTCAFNVTLQVPAAAALGSYTNTTSPLTSSLGSSVPATDTVLVVSPGDLNFSKEFVDDPVPPGDSTTLEFTIDNTSAGPVTNLFFIDDLDAVIPGLIAVPGLPAENPCGPGSSLSGTTRLIFSGGSLDPGTTCAFSVTLQVPAAAAPGSYTNTTSPLLSSVGSSVPATDTLLVSPVNFYPNSHPHGDFYSFEVSVLDVYNLTFEGGASFSIEGGPDLDFARRRLDTNDVLGVTGRGDESFGAVTPGRTARLFSLNPNPAFSQNIAIRNTIGVFTDGEDEVVGGLGQAAGATSINEVVADGGDARATGCGAVPLFGGANNGFLTFGFNQNDTPSRSVFYPGVNAVECSVEVAIVETAAGPMFREVVGSRPAGTGLPFDSLVDEMTMSLELPFRDFQAGAGIFGLGEGGTMYIDNMTTFNIRDSAGTTVLDLLNLAFDKELLALVKELTDRPAARELIEAAIAEITRAEQAISLGGFESGSRSADALRALSNAKDLDQQALAAIDSGDSLRFGQLLIEAFTAKARAELFMEGHNPQPGPFPDGLGGFDVGDPIFADGFESGDVSAWSE